ncbi:hypothetical protein [Mycobacteroides immunogenum]|uniref:hypothetical protein n=1 Tax=Mycobacteroides immunogenum TaxID=83262 RepID=UPI00069641DF|nr:hypothetical protein [Mycobacteroides immunogenum]ANO03908.1 hypothetical protein BAB75_11405 [Mycobacteroides immunogenum]MCV7304536.1 Mce protein [Mycobacteroides immunogenum]ORV73885.1 hypothetical protein AWC10_03460 [Mycobacteroides immunogenum]
MTGYPAPHGAQLRIVFASVMIGVAVIALCACGFLGWKLAHDGPILAAQRDTVGRERAEFDRDRRVGEYRDQAREAAEATAVTMTSIDSGNIDESFAKILASSTGEFKDEFGKSSVQLRQLLIDNQATAVGKVVASAVQSDTIGESEQKVVVLLMVDQSISNKARPDPRIDKSRMKMTMQLVDGHWLAGKLEYL